ncbi:hypothetical protein V5O48_004459 [Marasmius crinis-equi]|uniref:Uncharacterized protein n=1 Tax=Marasmius crinis-equi TaxID=585013 RepID=A0ABR3FQQ1_9AGAR
MVPEREDQDWAPSSNLLPASGDNLDHSQWVSFRDSEGLNKLLALAVSAQSDCVLGAIADIRRCMDTIKSSQDTYNDPLNQQARLRFLGDAPKSISVLWGARMEYFANEKDVFSDKFFHSRIQIRRYVSSILDTCLVDQRERYPALSPTALDLYYWLYLVSLEARERQHPDCQLSARVLRELDLSTMWSRVVPRLFSDVPLQALENRLLAALIPRATPLSPQMLSDTANILYHLNPVIIRQLRPFLFACFLKAAHRALYDLVSRDQNHQDVHSVIGITVLSLNKCREHRGDSFLAELYQPTPLPGSNIPIPLPGFQAKGELFDILIMSARSASALANEAFLEFLWTNVEYFYTDTGRPLRPILARDLDLRLLQGFFGLIAQDYPKKCALESMKALHALAGIVDMEAGQLPKDIVYGCDNPSCRSCSLLTRPQKKSATFQVCSGCKKALEGPQGSVQDDRRKLCSKNTMSSSSKGKGKEMEITSATRLVIPPLPNPATGSANPAASLSSLWAYLTPALDHIVKSPTNDTTRAPAIDMEFYSGVHSACYNYITSQAVTHTVTPSRKSPSSPALDTTSSTTSADLYDQLDKYFADTARELLLGAPQDSDLIDYIIPCFNRYSAGAQSANRLLNYVNRHYVKRAVDEDRGWLSIGDVFEHVAKSVKSTDTREEIARKIKEKRVVELGKWGYVEGAEGEGVVTLAEAEACAEAASPVDRIVHISSLAHRRFRTEFVEPLLAVPKTKKKKNKKGGGSGAASGGSSSSNLNGSGPPGPKGRLARAVKELLESEGGDEEERYKSAMQLAKMLKKVGVRPDHLLRKKLEKFVASRIGENGKG